MNCKEIHALLYLNRKGELSQSEARTLADHLMVCERCMKEKASIDGGSTLLRGLDGVPLVPSDPEGLTRRILERTSNPRYPLHRQQKTSLLDLLLNSFAAPTFRWASTGVIMLAIGMFLLQYFTILSEVHNLEMQQSLHGRASRVPRVAYVVDARPLQGTPEGVLLARLEGFAPDGLLTLDEQNAATWRATKHASSLGIASRPFSDDAQETTQTLMLYLKTNARPLLSFAREGV